MNYRLLTILSLVLAAFSATGLSAQSAKPTTAKPATKTKPAADRATVQQAVREVEQKWLESLFRSDVAALESAESADFTLLTPAVMLNRQAHLRTMRQQTRHGLPNSPSAVAVSNQSINVYGDVAVVSDVCSVTGGDSVIAAGHYLQTEVWHKEGATWKIVHMHITMLVHGM
jgi:ketosteroid isomerase-like protein